MNDHIRIGKRMTMPKEIERSENYDSVSPSSQCDKTPCIGDLKAATTIPIFIGRDQDVSEAITLMLTHDFSQLPVMQSQRRDVDGVISWKTIGTVRAIRYNEDLKVRDCLMKQKDFTIIHFDTPLLDAVDVIAAKDFVLVRDSMNKISGVVTTSDISLEFSVLSKPFLLLREIEYYIRQLITKLLSEECRIETLAANCVPADNRKIDQVTDLTFSQYVCILQSQANWEKLGIKLSQDIILARLREVNKIRNNVMHFRLNSISPKDLETLYKTRNLLSI